MMNIYFSCAKSDSMSIYFFRTLFIAMAFSIVCLFFLAYIRKILIQTISISLTYLTYIDTLKFNTFVIPNSTISVTLRNYNKLPRV